MYDVEVSGLVMRVYLHAVLSVVDFVVVCNIAADC